MEEEARMEKDVLEILENNSNRGLSITELVEISHLSRGQIRIVLARLEGAKKVSVRKVGMAKLYFLNKRKKGLK